MKYSGIVRRLDSLGRIVIPREYRKMHKIKESDPLEIIAMENGEIIIRKIDLSAELMSSGASIVTQLHECTGLGVMLSDTEKYLTGAGSIKNVLVDTILSSKAQTLIDSRKCYNGKASDMGIDGDYVCVYPIAVEDCFGALYLFSESEIGLEDERILAIVTKILGGIMQKY